MKIDLSYHDYTGQKSLLLNPENEAEKYQLDHLIDVLITKEVFHKTAKTWTSLSTVYLEIPVKNND